MKKILFNTMNENITVTGSTRQEVKYWNKLFEIPTDESPFFDETGDNAVSEDTLHRDTLYLAGSFGGDTTREFDVPEGGDKLVFPMISNTESAPKGDMSRNELCKNGMSFLLDDVDNDEPEIVVKDVFLNVDLHSDGSEDYSVHLDVSGVTYDSKTNKVDFSGAFFSEPSVCEDSTAAELAEELFNYPRAGGAKQITLPDDAVIGEDGPGEYLACTNGYFATIEDLSEGTHTITFGGSVIIQDDPDHPIFSTEVTDVVTII